MLDPPALTVKVFPGDNLMVHKALDVFYVTAGGKKQLEAETEEWEKINTAIGKVLRFA